MTLPADVLSEEALFFDAEGTPVDDPRDAATAEIVRVMKTGEILHTLADLPPITSAAGR